MGKINKLQLISTMDQYTVMRLTNYYTVCYEDKFNLIQFIFITYIALGCLDCGVCVCKYIFIFIDGMCIFIFAYITDFCVFFQDNQLKQTIPLDPDTYSKIIYYYLFILGCIGSSLLPGGLLQLRSCGEPGGGRCWEVGKEGLLPSCDAWASLVVENRLWAHTGFSSCGTQSQLLKACGIFQDQGLNLYPLPWQADF